jgi:serine/threonine protein kinase/class 3 adenylate cyclase
MAELRTFVFTDIVRSVELKRTMPGHSDAERDQAFIERVLTPHRERIERELAGYNGRVVSTAGDGHFLVFSDTISAARWAIGVQRSHHDEPIRASKNDTVSTRISIHLGIPQVDPRDPANFVGKPIDYASRLSDYATGGQILVSRSVVVVLEDAGMDGVSFHHHGRHELKGIGRVDIYELVYDPDGPRQMLREPRESMSRQWTVLPATVGLTEFGGGNAEGAGTRGGRAVAKPQAAPGPLKLGNYLLEERVGSGGMGEVYRARHSQFGRLRAVKVIRQHFVDSGHQEVIRRFYQEIKAVGALEHPNVVVAIDSSAPSDPVHYLVMEYIDGMGADELVKRRRQLPVAEACEIARQAARGLAYIHQHGMVHRDIKPSNLMITLVHTHELSGTGSAPPESGDRQAVVKILDLGLALLIGEDHERFTRLDNRTMGTAMYMSPEQWKTTSVDIRADIYSLGCTLYHLLAGKPPFYESDLKPEKAHEREELPPIRAATPIPRPLWDVLTQMTAKHPDDRFADPLSVAAALAPFADGHRLARLVDEETRRLHDDQTEGVAKSDTRVAQSAQSDTERGRSGSRTRRPKTLPPVARRTILQTMTAIATVIAVGGIGWLAWQATGRRESAQEALQARGHALQLAAGFATSEILKEINLRFNVLERLAAEPYLRQQMNQILEEPNNEALWTSLENWLGARKANHDREARADSWFINDVRGIQVARSPHSDASLGASYAQRDYFHGLGVHVPEDATDLKPIPRPHLSAVYRSTSSGHLKVAFSVPIENGLRGADRGVVGVLAMSVDLGEFDKLKQLPPGHEVVLIDLREAQIDGVTRRGLVLHHQAVDTYERGESPPWISDELLARFDELLAGSTRSSTAATPLIEYSDPATTGGKPYRAALKPVIDYRPDDQVIDRQWLVLVQEPALR